MKLIPILISLLLVCVSVSESWVAFGHQDIEPGQPVVCKDDDGREFKPGDTWTNAPNKGCYKMTCTDAGPNRVAMDTTGCGTVLVEGPGCKVISDESKPFPDCCPKPVCEKIKE